MTSSVVQAACSNGNVNHYGFSDLIGRFSFKTPGSIADKANKQAIFIGDLYFWYKQRQLLLDD